MSFSGVFNMAPFVISLVYKHFLRHYRCSCSYQPLNIMMVVDKNTGSYNG